MAAAWQHPVRQAAAEAVQRGPGPLHASCCAHRASPGACRPPLLALLNHRPHTPLPPPQASAAVPARRACPPRSCGSAACACCAACSRSTGTARRSTSTCTTSSTSRYTCGRRGWNACVLWGKRIVRAADALVAVLLACPRMPLLHAMCVRRQRGKGGAARPNDPTTAQNRRQGGPCWRSGRLQPAARQAGINKRQRHQLVAAGSHPSAWELPLLCCTRALWVQVARLPGHDLPGPGRSCCR